MFTIVSEPKLDKRQTADLGELMESCVAFDGAACLEMDSSLNAHKDMNCFFLGYYGSRLQSAVSIFAPLKNVAELNALTLPEARRRGVFRALLAKAEIELRKFGYSDELFVLEARSISGKATAGGLGARYEFTEYAMRHEGPCPDFPRTGLSIECVGIERLEELIDLRAGEFGDSREEAEAFERATFAAPNRQVYAGFLDGRMIAVCSLGFQESRVSINGLVVEKRLRGSGYGQTFLSEILSHLCTLKLEIILDVNSENANAYHIYRKMGFVEDKAVEYYRRKLPD